MCIRLALFLLLILPTSTWASGLVVTPQRVVLEGREREAQVTLSNTGNEETAYRLYWVNYKMLSTGEFEPVTQPTNEFFTADKYVRFSPRQVVLPPGETQVIRLLVRMPPKAEAGEYRSHLVFQALPKQPAFEPNRPKGKTSAVITTLYGISIPIIVRRGYTSASVAIGEVHIDSHDGQAALQFGLRREGNQSVYGNVRVQQYNGKAWEDIGAANGVAVYVPLAERQVRVPLRSIPETNQTFRVIFEDAETQKPLAQKTVDLK